MKWFRGPFAFILCLGLAIPSTPVLADPDAEGSGQAPENGSKSSSAAQLQGDTRILHALGRFTFGPRPGDLEAVRSIGLEKWFDLQLHPENIDETELDARLAEFPAMRANPQDLLFRLPSNAVIRQAIDGKIAVPEGGVLHTIYTNEMARVEFRQQAREQKKLAVTANSDGGTMVGGAAMDEGAGKMAAETAQISQPATMSMNSAESNLQPPADPAIVQAQIPAVLTLAPQRRVNRLAAMTQPEFDSFRKALKPQQRIALVAGLTPAQKEMVAALENPQRLVAEELAAQRLTRAIYSSAQLQEVMTDFWLNHFNVYLHKNEETPYYLASYERDVIRPRALGKFEDLLVATAHSPAMLLYLDNSISMGPDSPAAERSKIAAARRPGAQKKAEGLNENYARELMELHTLGVNGGYTQADVTQVARVFTGWTVDRPQRGGGFRFDENRHEPGAKKVLGKKIKENGEQEGRQVLHMLATRPATARFICRKLAVRFVADDPPQSLVDRMAKSYLASGGNISKVLKTLFRSPEFWSQDTYRAKVKTPIEFVVSAVRASGANVENLQPLANALREMGMPVYGAVPPTGYNWQSSAWVSTGQLVNRMNFALSLAANKLPGVAVAWSTAVAAPGENEALPDNKPDTTPAAEEQRLQSLLVEGGLNESTRTALLDQFESQTSTQPGLSEMPVKPVSAGARIVRPAQAATALERQDQLLAGLLLGSPEFQRR